MSHPFGSHREHSKSHSRVHHILKGHPDGAAKHQDGSAFSHTFSKRAAANHDHKARGGKTPKRYARGGKVKPHHTTNVIVVPGHHPGPPTPGPQAGASPMPPPPAMGGAPGLPPPPPGGMGGGMPPGLPGGMPRARGGRAFAKGGKVNMNIAGEASAANLDKWSKRASSNSYAKGGAIRQTGGASTGVGRLEGAEMVARKQGHKGAK